MTGWLLKGSREDPLRPENVTIDENFQVTEQLRKFRQTINITYRFIVIAVLCYTLVSAIVSQNIRM